MWPPQFIIKKHHLARNVKLKASIKNGLEIIVPLRFSQKHIPEILEQNRSWIEKNLARIQDERAAKVAQPLPTQVTLSAISQEWQVNYLKTDTAKIHILSKPQQSLVVYGDIENEFACKARLIQWLKNQAKKYLVEQLQILSQQTQLSFKNATIRGQTTRWGSCSRDKSINLNYKLLFLPAYLVNHIMIHELCHTVHLNHSKHFWQLVASFDPNWSQHSREVRQAEKWVPGWVEINLL
jgi:predicted metal-dependent hydrolase